MLRLLLDRDDQLTPHQLAARADKLWAKHSNQHKTDATVTKEEHPFATIQSQKNGPSGFKGIGSCAAGAPITEPSHFPRRC
jgi:hypothetical protein